MANLEKPNSNSSPEETGPSLNGRRRVLKGAAAIAPVILTATSRPVLGGACTPSGFLSGNLSHQHDAQVCNGRSPGYWKQPKWFPAGEVTTTYASEFVTVWKGKAAGNWDTNVTLLQVLQMKGFEDLFKFGMHSVAALLNARYEPDGNYPMTETQVKDLVNQVLLYGYYTDPVSGQTLDAEEAVFFIQGTFS